MDICIIGTSGASSGVSSKADCRRGVYRKI